MTIAGMILGCALLGQASDAALPPPISPTDTAPAALQPPPASQSAEAPPPAATDIPQARNPRRPPELVDEAIHMPADGALTGRPFTLLEALESTADRRRQMEIVRAYWRLVETAAEYRFCWEYARQFPPAGGEDATARSLRASVAAQIQDANLQAVRAQFELAALVQMPSDDPLPLPADPPHVGAYRTFFNELFAGRTPPENARLADKILPLQRRAIDEAADAVLAAEDALLAVNDDFRAGRAGAAAVAASARDLLQRRRAFIRLVCDYNRTIADYGLSVLGLGATAHQLVATLIGPARQAAAPPRSADARGSVVPPAKNEPTLAPPRPKNEPTPAPPRDQWRANEPTPAPPREPIERAGYDEPMPAPPRERPRNETPGATDERLAPVDPQSAAPLPLERPERSVEKLSPPLERPERIVKKPLPPLESSEANRGGGAPAAAAATPLYPALKNASPAEKVKQLTATIHWDRYLPKDAGKPLGLKECLERDAESDRLGTICAYWLLRRRAAQYHILAEQAEFLDALVPAVLERRNDPTGAADMLRLNAAQLAARADLSRARVDLLEAQFDLALRIGAAGEAGWPLASTVPHSGDYLLKLEAQPQSLAAAWPVRRLAATIPAQCESVRQRAVAVVEAEAARVSAAEAYRSGGVAVDGMLDSVAAQTGETAAFLDALVEYNLSIAEYALTILPPSTPAEKLVAALVVKP